MAQCDISKSRYDTAMRCILIIDVMGADAKADKLRLTIAWLQEIRAPVIKEARRKFGSYKAFRRRVFGHYRILNEEC